jgi:hypothetical protein
MDDVTTDMDVNEMIETATAELDALVHGGEYEHFRADEILCEVLEKLGHTKLVAAYNRIQPKWYA